MDWTPKQTMKKAACFGLAAMLALTAAGCGSKEEPKAPAGTSAVKTWSEPPKMAIDANKAYTAEVATTKGKFTIELYAKDAPKTVNNFVFLSKQGFYNDVIFHRIIRTFMIQTGDPEGTGRGGPGYKFEDELSGKHKYEIGTVAMANAGKNTNGSQFFICTGDACPANLNSNPNYTIFGKVVSGMDAVQSIAATPVGAGQESTPSKPLEKVAIQTITITEK